MPRKSYRSAALVLALTAGGAAVSASAADARATDMSLCEQSRSWSNAASTQATQVVPQVSEQDGGRTYRFDLGGRGGLQTMTANCGLGSYAECSVDVIQANGAGYQFSEISTFGLWETPQGLYLVYRIVAPKDEAASSKRRVVKVSNPPQEICNQIGDYSNLM